MLTFALDFLLCVPESHRCQGGYGRSPARLGGLHPLHGNSYFGLPDITWLRVLPLDDQPLPVPGSQSAISSLSADDDPSLDVYTLSGVWLRTERQSQLGISLGDRSSAVLVLPGSTDGAPNIVRRSTRQ